MAIMDKSKKLENEELEQINGGTGDGDEPCFAPHCILCGTYDVDVYLGSSGISDKYFGYCDKCRCEWNMEYYHQSPLVVTGSKSPL